MPLMQDMIINGEARSWQRVLDLGSGDGRLGRSARDAYRFAADKMDGYVMGVESDDDRVYESQHLFDGMDYVWCMTLDEWMPLKEGPLREDLIIANPPFSLAEEFLTCALRIRAAAHDEGRARRPTVAFLLRLNFMGAQKRYPFWSAAERPKLRVLSERPSFTDGGTDMTDYAWFIWTDRDIPALDWYPPQG
jgi:hypothetical protein